MGVSLYVGKWYDCKIIGKEGRLLDEPCEISGHRVTIDHVNIYILNSKSINDRLTDFS